MNEIGLTIECMYTCHACGITKQKVSVPARTSEEVVPWVQATAQRLGMDHCMRSPQCAERKIDLWIPITGADRVGGAPVH